MSDDFKIVVCISGRGSNLKSLLENSKNYKIIAVVSDNCEAGGLELARSSGIDTYAFARKSFDTLKDHKRAIYDQIRSLQPSLIALAGFMQIVEPAFVQEYESRIVNIHPALLPDLAGLHTHERAISEKRSWHGCTVHFVDSGVDTGPIIAQARVPVEASDTADVLAARVLQREHKLYPWVVNSVAAGEIICRGREIEYSTRARQEAQELDFGLAPARMLKVQALTPE